MTTELDARPWATWKREHHRPFPKRSLPGHCLAIMLAAWRGQALVPQARIVGLEHAFNPALHPELSQPEALLR